MSIIVPTITAENPHIYREQIERVSDFAKRIHIDLMDGLFTKNTGVDIKQVWLPKDIICDIHVMYKKPESILQELTLLKPNLVVVHVESDCDLKKFAENLHSAGIKCGIALFPETKVEAVAEVLPFVEQALIFTGNLGHQGGSQADLNLLNKIPELKSINNNLEIAWDGGINAENAAQIAKAGVDVLNVGGFIQATPNAGLAYASLIELLP